MQRGGYSGFIGALILVGIFCAAFVFSPLENILNPSLRLSPNDLLLYYHLDDISGGTTKDASNLKLNGNVVGAQLVAGKVGSALSFDGSDYVGISNAVSLHNPQTITVSGWFSFSDIAASSGWQTLALKGDFTNSPFCDIPGCGNREFGLFLNNKDKRFELVVTPRSQIYTGGQEVCSTGSLSLANDKWYHVAGVIDATEAVTRIYVDGTLHATCALPKPAQPIRESTGKFILGYMKGAVDEFKVYNRVLKEGEIKALYGNSEAIALYYQFDTVENNYRTPDSSGSGRSGVVSGASLTSGKINQAISLGGNDFIEAENSASLDLTDKFTLSTWMYLTSNTQGIFGQKMQRIVEKTHDGALWPSYSLRVDNINGQDKIAFGMYDGYQNSANQQNREVYSNNVITKGKWYLVTLVFNAGDASLYINGVLDNSKRIDATPYDNQAPLLIGAGKSSSGAYRDFFNGYLDDLRIYNRVLSASEIQSLYGASLQSGVLQLYYPFNQIANNRIEDASNNNYDGAVNGARVGGGVVGNAMVFDGDDYITTESDLDIGPAFTIGGWVRLDKNTLDTGQNEQRILSDFFVGAGGKTVNYGSLSLTVGAENRIKLGIRSADSSQSSVGAELRTPEPLQIGRWYNVVGRRDSKNNFSLYLDGKAVSSIITPVAPYLSDKLFTWGSTRYSDGQNQDRFHGALDEFRIHYSSLTDEEIASLYAREINSSRLAAHYPLNIISQGETPDISANQRNAMVAGGRIAKGVVGNAMVFDGDDYIIGNDFDLGETFSISMWAYLNKTSANLSTLVSDGAGSDSLPSVSIVIDGPRKVVATTRYENILTSSVRVDSGNTSLKDMVWQHIVLKRENGRLKLYLNKALVGDVAAEGKKPYDNQAPLLIGAGNESSGSAVRAFPNNFFRGLLDDIYIYRYAINSEEITSLYNLGVVVSGTVGCIPKWDCSWSACQQGIEVYICNDIGKCGTNLDKPSIEDRACVNNQTYGTDCIDNDGDGYGIGSYCLGADIDDYDALINVEFPDGLNTGAIGSKQKWLIITVVFAVIAIAVLALIIYVVVISRRKKANYRPGMPQPRPPYPPRPLPPPGRSPYFNQR